MTLTDTGPLVALLDPRDRHHSRCVTALQGLSSEDLLTTWPCLTEAAYILRREGGHPLLERLWQLWETGLLRLYLPAEGETARIRALMDIYRDLPCDLADASLIAAAETLGTSRIFTLDSHFYAYRMRAGDAFEVVP